MTKEIELSKETSLSTQHSSDFRRESGMEVMMKRFSLILGLVFLGVLSACSGSDPTGAERGASTTPSSPTSSSISCSSPVCPNDPPESEKDQKDCEAEYAGSCGGLWGSARECMFRNVKCSASGLRTNDWFSTIETACEAPLGAYRACIEQQNSRSTGR